VDLTLAKTLLEYFTYIYEQTHIFVSADMSGVLSLAIGGLHTNALEHSHFV
jgi:glycine/serine hydroxymethyltransferase